MLFYPNIDMKTLTKEKATITINKIVIEGMWTLSHLSVRDFQKFILFVLPTHVYWI